ncbi:uncharacterized protein EI90DRAFT_3020860 [Cantharellus anzutake]|uniref:uncharacterized protein n=1 Tax=Cantharellus anzutake TaxID=1750568 RepID=UPI0019089845|nr:uncharacterized protein EI90DRAFT_3020860 [Cantharellus anzutake]KAF8319158.1 hypothetical protein EI90DRAFT_3020860 [Cantharellus anzutake]
MSEEISEGLEEKMKFICKLTKSFLDVLEPDESMGSFVIKLLVRNKDVIEVMASEEEKLVPIYQYLLNVQVRTGWMLTLWWSATGAKKGPEGIDLDIFKVIICGHICPSTNEHLGLLVTESDADDDFNYEQFEALLKEMGGKLTHKSCKYFNVEFWKGVEGAEVVAGVVTIIKKGSKKTQQTYGDDVFKFSHPDHSS